MLDEGINLDGLTTDPDTLMRWWATHQRGRNARELFPSRRAGYRRATADLANYAANKSTAMSCRLRGDISTAEVYEHICERIYRRLPEWARW